jgi:hypothetical protein
MASPTPLLPDVGIMTMPYHTFGSHWMTVHYLSTRLSSYFNVLWMEPAHHWRNAGKVGARRLELAALRDYCPPNFEVYLAEPWLPTTHNPPALRTALMRARVRRGWRRLRERGATTKVLHLWHHQFEAAIGVGKPDLTLYHIDDDYSFLPEPGPMDPEEARVIKAVDRVFAISPGLMERKGGINPNMTFAPEAVDFQRYAARVPEPHDLKAIPRPRMGYTGALKPQLDWLMLRALVAHHPEWSFVFVGPNNLPGDLRQVLEEMARLPNVHLLGRKTVVQLAEYPQHFDVCMMPYAQTGYTNNIYPLKLHEYLASGQPAVGAPIRSLRDFDKIIRLATTREEWSAALAQSLLPPDATPAAAFERQRIARAHDWSEIVHRVARTICEDLGPSFSERFEELAPEPLPPPANEGAPV